MAQSVTSGEVRYWDSREYWAAGKMTWPTLTYFDRPSRGLSLNRDSCDRNNNHPCRDAIKSPGMTIARAEILTCPLML